MGQVQGLIGIEKWEEDKTGNSKLQNQNTLSSGNNGGGSATYRKGTFNKSSRMLITPRIRPSNLNTRLRKRTMHFVRKFTHHFV